MEDNKYFTPEIEDIRVGYECEAMFTDMKWHPFTYDTHDFSVLKEEVLNEQIRVPFLTKEQIEAEGWTTTEGKMGHQKGDRYKLLYGWIKSANKITNHLSILDGELVRYCGQCKDINTFRYISKLLGI